MTVCPSLTTYQQRLPNIINACKRLYVVITNNPQLNRFQIDEKHQAYFGFRCSTDNRLRDLRRMGLIFQYKGKDDLLVYEVASKMPKETSDLIIETYFHKKRVKP